MRKHLKYIIRSEPAALGQLATNYCKSAQLTKSSKRAGFESGPRLGQSVLPSGWNCGGGDGVDLVGVFGKSALDALCEKYYIPIVVQPLLPGRNDRIRNSPPEIDLFAFITHAGPTKVRIEEREVDEERFCCFSDQTEQAEHVINVGGFDVMVDDEVQAIVVDKPRRVRKKRKVANGASGSGLPPKKLREDHGTSSISANTGGKSVATLQSLLEESTLPVKVGVAAAATMPFVTSSVTPDSIFRTRPWTRHPAKRFVISLDSSHDINADATDDEVTFAIRSSMPPPLLLTVVVATTITAGVTSALVHGSGAGQLRGMDYEQLLAEFNVRNARQVCFSIEIRVRLEHELRGRQRFEGKCAMQAIWLKERVAKIASMKAQLSLKEAEAAEAIRLCDAELASSNAQVAKVTQDLSSLQLSCDELSVKASSLEFKKDKLVDQEHVEAMQDEQVKSLGDCVTAIDSDLMEMALHMDEEFYPREVIGRAIDKGMQDELATGIDYGKAGRGIVDALQFFCGSRLSASMADITELLCFECPAAMTPEAIQLQPSPKQFMVPIHRGDVAACRLSLTDVMVPLNEPLSVKSLTGEASTSGVPVMAMTTALTMTFIQASVVPSAPSAEVPHSSKIVFEKEELDTTSEHIAAA
nr:hypothetical protein [Tanacetum cinerariifolium]